jgi:2-polyprenyl-6-methoxyphenol hydroxylase-like FAD-dependent oxidoreductase
MTSVYQPAFEAELDRLARADPHIDLHTGETVTRVRQDDESVEVSASRTDGQTNNYRGRYLIGADGGNSLVRSALGIEYIDLGFDQDWLVIDGRSKNDHSMSLPQMRQFCEPEQPGMTMQMGPYNRRWSFMILPGESREEAVRHENVWRRLDRAEGGTAADFDLIRVATYKFRSLLAERWQAGRVFLAGDAAHQMPPFLAQGLCSGFRDAYNLTWKLDLVLHGRAPPSFLDTYEEERSPNARATIIESARVGQNVIERDLERAAQRDETLLRLHAEMQARTAQKSLIAFRVPGYEAGLVAGGIYTRGAGDVFPQGRVRLNGSEGRFDDIAGRGWLILSRNGDPAEALSPDDLAFWQSLGGSIIRIGESEGLVVDLDGAYSALMDEYGCNVILKRPDYYLFGAVPNLTLLPALIADLRRQILGGS